LNIKSDYQMSSTKIAEYLSAEPFQPFRIKMVSGQTFDIRHPEMIMVGRSSVRVYKASDADPDGPPRWWDVSLTLMEMIEPIELRSTAGMN
jgi:hypothetical protein